MRVELRRRQHPARDLDPLHVARVVELVVEPVGEADRTPGIVGELAAQEACEPIGVAGERVAVLLLGGSHAS